MKTQQLKIKTTEFNKNYKINSNVNYQRNNKIINKENGSQSSNEENKDKSSNDNHEIEKVAIMRIKFKPWARRIGNESFLHEQSTRL